MFGLILGGLYALFKLVDSVQRVKDWNTAFRKLFQNVVSVHQCPLEYFKVEIILNLFS